MIGRVVVADASPLLRAGARAVLGRVGAEVVEAGDLDELRAAFARRVPAVALVDVDLPPVGGAAAIEELAVRSGTRMIVWGLDSPDHEVIACIRSGAAGFLPKDVSADALVRSLAATLRGEAPVPRGLVSVMVDELQGVDRRERARRSTARLSSRECEVLALVAHGARNREIASELAISELTVKRHVQNILQKLDVASRSGAASLYQLAAAAEPASVGAPA